MVLYDRGHDLLNNPTLFQPRDVRYLEFFESTAGDIIQCDEVIASQQLHNKVDKPFPPDFKGGLRMM